MSLAIRQEEQGEFRVLALSGRLDTETSADLELAIADLQAAGANQFLVDLAEVGYVSSAGLRVLLATAKQLEGGRGALKLCCLNESVRQVFDVAGFTRLFAIFATRDAALASVDKAPPAKSRESSLAKTAATLLGAKPTDAASGGDPEAASLARADAELLGGRSSGAKPVTKPKPAPAKPAEPPPAKAPDAGEPSGVLGRFRGLFGKK